MNLRCAALNTGPDIHLLDHIAPLAHLMQMPLIATEERNAELSRLYYPQIETRYMPDLEFQLADIAEQFDVLFECKYWVPHLKGLFRQIFKKEMRLVFCPHGQSDKGFKAPLLAPYAQQDAVLLYGELLISMLRELGIWPSISNYALIGNHRLLFYRKHQAFYDELAEREVFSRLDHRKPTLLYAPTWRDADQSTSFFHHGSAVLSQLPSDWNLILKLHPLLEQRDPAYFYRIAALADKKSNALLLTEFPPVYPLLAKTDVYLGDFSSVGYDFLAFQKPMFFLPTHDPANLHSCGQFIDPSNLYTFLDRSITNPFPGKQAELYRFAFGEPQTEEQIRGKIFSALA